MARHSTKLREEARRLYLTSECTSTAEIARRLKVKAHTVARWKRSEDWDRLRLKIDKRAAEQMVERLASERVTLNARHYKFWEVIGGRMVEVVKSGRVGGDEIKDLERMTAILERMQKGQRLARGLSLDGQTEEQVRAEAQAEMRSLVDLFIDVVKQHVTDERTRDLIARTILERVPAEEVEGTDDAA
jgi:Phage terminase small subunit